MLVRNLSVSEIKL